MHIPGFTDSKKKSARQIGQTKWFYALGGLKEGPFTEAEMVELIEDGHVLAATPVWHVRMDEWQPLSDTALASHLGSGTASRPAREDQTPSYRPTSGVAWMLSILLPVATGLNLYLCYLVWEVGDTNALFHFLPDWFPAMGIGTLVLSILGIVCWCNWTMKSAENVRAFGARDLQFSPGWAAGWHFIPVMNVFQPYLAMKEIWRATISPKNLAKAKLPGVVEAWWYTWIFSFVATIFAMFLGPIVIVYMIALVSYVVSMLTALAMVWGLTRRQKNKAAVLDRAEFEQELNDF